jgi:hypothetical protein
MVGIKRQNFARHSERSYFWKKNVYDVLQWTTSYFYYLTLSKSLLFILSLQALK